MTTIEVAAKVRTSVAFYLNLNRPTTDEEIAAFNSRKLKDRPLSDFQADNIATSIRKKMRKENEDFSLAGTEVQNAATVKDLIELVQGRMP